MRHAMRYSHACNVEWKMIRRERADGFGTEEVITLATAIAIVSRICSHPRSPLHSLPPPGRRLLRPSAHLPWRGITHHAICTIPDSPTVAVLQEICFCYADETRYELLADEITTEVFPAAIYPHASVYTPAPPPTHLQAWNDPAGDAMRASMRATWAQRLTQKSGDMIIRGLKPLSAEEERQKALQQHVQLKQVPPTIPFLVHCPTRQTCMRLCIRCTASSSPTSTTASCTLWPPRKTRHCKTRFTQLVLSACCVVLPSLGAGCGRLLSGASTHTRNGQN